MKFTTTALLSLLSAAVAVSATIASHDSGLHTLGERSFERKARHVELAARAVSSNESQDLESRDWVSKWGKLTWYAGDQLLNPACGGPNPTDESMIVAVKENGGYGKCGEKVHIHYNGKMVEAHIVDYCASCEWGHFDASKAVFSRLAPLDQGVLEGIHFKLFTHRG